MRIVLTGPSSTPYARSYLSSAGTTLRERGHRVFVTHEGSWQGREMEGEESQSDLDATIEALHEADLLLAVLDEYSVDDSVAAHIGAFHLLARDGDRPRRIIGILHDTRVAGWDWAGRDNTLAPQIRQRILEFGAIYPSLEEALARDVGAGSPQGEAADEGAPRES